MLEPPEHLTPTEQAIFYVAQYPCQHCLFPKLSTADQFSSFWNWRIAQTHIALCWKTRLAGHDDPLYLAMKQGVISKDFYEWAHLKASYFETLWVLCQLLVPQMAERTTKLGREDLGNKITALFLFRAAVMEKANWQIEISCDYVEVSGRNVDTALKLQAKAIKKGLTQKEALRLQRLTLNSSKSKFSSLLRIMMALNFNNKAVKGQFELFMLATANLCEKEATMARKGGSYGWDNGVKLTGTGSGVYVPIVSEA
jgi:hypothetical protein